MTIYRNKRDGKLYILSINSPLWALGEWLECAEYRTGNPTWWKKVPQYKKNDFIPVGVR